MLATADKTKALILRSQSTPRQRLPSRDVTVRSHMISAIRHPPSAGISRGTNKCLNRLVFHILHPSLQPGGGYCVTISPPGEPPTTFSSSPVFRFTRRLVDPYGRYRCAPRDRHSEASVHLFICSSTATLSSQPVGWNPPYFQYTGPNGFFTPQPPGDLLASASEMSSQSATTFDSGTKWGDGPSKADLKPVDGGHAVL